MSRYIPVEPEKWAEMVKAMAEVTRLKAEVERSRDQYNGIIDTQLKVIDELKAEVERLTEDNRQLNKAFEIAEGIIKRMGNAAENAAKEGKPSV